MTCIVIASSTDGLMQLSTDMRIDDLFKLESIELRLAQSI